MKIAIDLQACQTPESAQRGIGRYSMELAKAIARNRGPHSVHCLLNQAFTTNLEAFEDELRLSGDVTFEQYRLLSLDEARGEHRLKLQRINDEILNWRYACSGADALHISSMFEGWLSGDAHVTARIADVPVRARSATLYDLIPLLFADKYLPSSIRQFYLAKLGLFQQLDLVFAISESSRQDAIRHLNILPERIINIRAAASATFRRLESIEPARARETLARYGLGPRFILYTGGIDFRKNIDALLVAYAALPAEITRDIRLAIVCAVTSDQRLALLQRVETLGIMGATVFTGYIPDDDLNLLYNVCELFVFPSLYEGFGLPLLEAMTCGACIIASNTSSMPEIVGSPEVLFDPHDSAALTRMMRDLLMAPDRRRQMGASNHRRSREFSWDDVARRFIGALEESTARRRHAPVGVASGRRPKVALVTPLPPQRSGIADYSASMLPYWSRYFELDLVADGYTPELDKTLGSYRVVSMPEFGQRSRHYDYILYHFGNSEVHSGMYDLLRRYPGIVVMHDFFLSHLVHGMDGTGGKTGIFDRELTAAHGEKAAHDIEAVARGQLQWNDLLYRYPVSRKVIQHARGVIFHSQYAADLLLDAYPDLSSVPTCIVPQACAVSFDPAERQSARAALDLGSDDLLVCAIGFLGEIKENELLLHALSSPRLSDDRRIRVAFVGALEVDPHRTRINALIARHPMRERIEVTGYIDEMRYRHYLLACDIGVSLRTKSRGETSAAMQKQLAVGCATIVSDYAAMRELPDEIVCKVPSSDAEALVRALKALCDDSTLRARLGAAARRWAVEWCHPAHVAEQYSSAIASLSMLDRARSAAGLVKKIGALVAEDQLAQEISLPAGKAIAEGLSLHPASGRWLPLGP